MIKKLSLFLFLILICPNVYAQENYKDLAQYIYKRTQFYSKLEWRTRTIAVYYFYNQMLGGEIK